MKAVLPAATLRWCVEQHHHLKFISRPALSFDAAGLGSISKDAIDKFMNGTPPAWEHDFRATAAVYGAGERFGGVNPGDRRALYHLVAGLRPENVLEVGTHVGASTLYIAMALKTNGRGIVTTVDVRDVNGPDGWWKRVDLPMPPRAIAAEIGCRDQVEFVTSSALAYMTGTARRFDLIFLDGDHGVQTVYDEVAAALKIIRPGGLILLHDYYPEGMATYPGDYTIRGPRRAMQRITRENGEITVLPLGALPWQTKQGTTLTTLAVVAHS